MDVGSSVMFNCSTVVTCTGNVACMNVMVDVTWIRDEGMLDVTVDNTYTSPTSTVDIMQPGANSSTPVSFVLMTNGTVQFSHAGSYQCEVSYNNSTIPESSSLENLTVQCKSTC